MNILPKIDHDGRKEYAPFYDCEKSFEVLDSSIEDVEWLFENGRPSDANTVQVMDMIERLQNMIGIKK